MHVQKLSNALRSGYWRFATGAVVAGLVAVVTSVEQVPRPKRF